MTRASFFAALATPFLCFSPRRTTTLSAAVPTRENTTIRVAPRKVEEGIEILSSWVDPNTGDTIALVLLKKNLQNSETPRTLLV